MQKDFDNWSNLKQELQQRRPPLFSEKQIWWCVVGCNIGYAQDDLCVLYWWLESLIATYFWDCLYLPKSKIILIITNSISKTNSNQLFCFKLKHLMQEGLKVRWESYQTIIIRILFCCYAQK
jgi:hypothetical protein